MKFNSSKIIIIIIIIISIVTVNINYTFSIINSRNLILINILNHKENYFEGINNSLNRFEIANLFEEEYEDIRKLIIFGNWGNDLISKNNMFSSISEDEIIYILDKYASLKKFRDKRIKYTL